MADAGSRAAAPDRSGGAWWDWHLFGLWILVNGLAFIVIPLAGAALQQLASLATKNLVQDNRALVVLIIACGLRVTGSPESPSFVTKRDRVLNADRA